MITIRMVLMILAVLCLGLSAIGIQAPRANLQSVGLTLWALAVLIG